VRRRAPHLVTTAARAVTKAVREQTGYPRVSRRKLDEIAPECPWCGRAMRHEMDRGRKGRAWETPGYFVCETGRHQMWVDRLSRRRWDRRYEWRVSQRGVARNMWYMPPPPPPRRVRRAVVFGLIALIKFAQTHGRST
jgi:hypothetical protein